MTDNNRLVNGPSSSYKNEANEALGEYFRARRLYREEAVVAKYAALTAREKSIFGEAAVLAYVQGFRASPHRKDIPGTREILFGVLSDVDSFADLYPTLAALPNTLPPDPDLGDDDDNQ